MIKDNISLIANSGLQFYNFEEQLDPSLLRQNKVRFIEGFDSGRKSYWLDEIIALPEGRWAKKSQLEQQGFLLPGGNISSEIDFSKLELINEPDFYETGNINQILKSFEKKWIPIPFFKKNNINDNVFGPTDWVRLYFENSNNDNLKIVILIDSSTTSEQNSIISPVLNENQNENIYSICSDDNLTLQFLDSLSDCKWIEDYIKKIFFPENIIIPERPFCKHIANYLFLIRILRSLKKLPEIQLLSDNAGNIDIDLVVDIGNTNTCALLFENQNDRSFNFNAVKKLEIKNFSNPLITYSDSFSTRLVFKDAQFGVLNSELNQNNKFQWPSAVRIGSEAEAIINNENFELRLAREIKTYNSSPKRYLWDNKVSEIEWEFHQDDSNSLPRRVYKKGVSEQINSDGSICTSTVFGSKSMFSRKSLMTFVFIELFCHAIRQINSIGFRSGHGNPSKKRKLRHIVLSCPTAMLKEEQIALRQCAVDAMKIINNYYIDLKSDSKTISNNESEVLVIPSVKDLKLDLSNLDKRNEWIFDEATSSQLVLLYGMIQHKFDGNPNLFFNLYGKPITNNILNKNRSVIVGSLDIGGGTSDLMVCKHDYLHDEITELTPIPLYWESFNLAGDDLIKVIIQEIIIEGKNNSINDENCSGVIENFARKTGIPDIAKLLNGFFGKDSNNIGARGKLMRTSFINQIGIPIAYKYMEIANSNDDRTLSFDELFPSIKPNKELLDYFASYFGFRFEQLKWKLSSRKVNEIIEAVFSKLIKQVVGIMHKYSCDLVILSGRPCSLNDLEELFLKYHPVSPNRIINLNKYWIGRWYPFADNNGFVHDPKTIVSVGSLIALMGGSLFKLDKFRINTTHLKTKLISTADYIGAIKDNSIKDNEVFLTIDKNEASFHIYNLPFQIGFKNVNSENYPSRNIYSFQFNNEKIAEILTPRMGKHSININDAVEDFKSKLRGQLPFKVTVSRDLEKDKESLTIVEILDKDKNEITKTTMDLSLQSLTDQIGYWLDTGEFILNINH